MKILVNGREAVLKANASFEYVSENPLFTEAEDYTMEIPFPMKDCPQNIAIFGPLHVKGVDISKVSFPCEIQTDAFFKSGILTITSVSDTEVKGQFLEGMSTKSFAGDAINVYLDEIDFSAYDGTDLSDTSVVRVNGDGWADLLVFDSNKEDFFRTKEDADGGTAPLPGGGTIPLPKVWGVAPVRHIYLYKLIEILSNILDISIDTSILEKIDMFRNILIANASYDLVYDYMNLEKTLPHWTIREFFTHLSNFFGCVCYIEGASHSLKLLAKKDVMNYSHQVPLDVLDDFEIELQDESECSFAGNKKFALPDVCNERNINSCPWIFEHKDLFDVVSTSGLSSTIHKFALGTWADQRIIKSDRVYQLTNQNNAWAVICEKEERKDIAPDVKSEYFLQYEILNQYGDCFDGETLKIHPCVLKMKRLRIGYMFSSDGSLNSGVDYALYYRCPVLEPTQSSTLKSSNIMATLEGGKKGYEPCDKLQLVLHTGSEQWFGYHLNTKKYEIDAGTEYAEDTKIETEGEVPLYSGAVREYGYTLSPQEPTIQAYASLPKVDETKLYRYKFLAKTLPSPTSVFLIKGKRYACLKLTAQITVKGMSELVEGEFYEIID